MEESTRDTLAVMLPAIQPADTATADTLPRTFRLGTALTAVRPGDSCESGWVTATVHDPSVYTSSLRARGIGRNTDTLFGDTATGILAFSLLLIAILIAAAGKSVAAGIATLSFRRQPDMPAPSTSGVLSWPPVFRNLFTIMNVGLFGVIALFLSGSPAAVNGIEALKMAALFIASAMAALMLRHLVSIVIAAMTDLRDLFREYMNVLYNAWFLTATVLFIVNCLVLYAMPDQAMPLIISGAAAASVLLIIRSLRLLFIFLNRHVSIFYYILYLCALEVLPVLLILKILGVF